MLTLFFLFLGVVLASAICSMSEAAILSLPLVRARILVEQKRKNSRDVLFLKENIRETIATIVILNNAINIVGAVFVGQQVTVRFGDQWLGLASTVMTFSIIIASEIIPKTIGERYKIPLSLSLAPSLRGLLWFFRPLVRVLVRIVVRPLMRGSTLPKVTEDEITMMLKLGRDAGTVEMDEEVLCRRVFRLNDLRAFQIMKSIDQIYALPSDKTLGELRETIIKSRFSRIAVYDRDPKDIVGMVQHRVLLREIANDNYNAHVRDFMTEPIFVNWFMKADQLLEKFQAYNQHLFIVQDANGKDVGLVTMEDVLEELFGEIYDEKDIHPKADHPGEAVPKKFKKQDVKQKKKKGPK